MRDLVCLVFMLALAVAGCSETAGSGAGDGGSSGRNGGAAGVGGSGGVGGTVEDRPWRSAIPEEADIVCQAWCEAGCDDETGCYERCRLRLAQTCGVHDLALFQCALDRECSIYHSDCARDRGAIVLCEEEISSACAQCSGAGCFNMGGRCDATGREGACRIRVDSGQCADLATCSLNDGDFLIPCVGDVSCVAWPQSERLCSNGEIAPIEPCCELPSPPDQPDACDGTESVENATSCTGDGPVVTYLLTQLEILGDCNVGYDLDGCFGRSCIQGGLTAAEGMDGVDNGLAGLARVVAGIGSNLVGINQAFSDHMCGKTSDYGETCAQDIPQLELRLVVNADVGESCAEVTVSSGATELGVVAMNLSDDGCLSGMLPDLPLEYPSTGINFSNLMLRATISEAGFSNGVMGATGNANFEAAISEALFPAGSVINQLFDINEDLSGDYDYGCNAVSGTYRIGGVVEP